jgi:hypothetical protein
MALSSHQPAEFEPPPTWLHVHCTRCSALAKLGRTDDAAREAEAALAVRLAEIADLSMAGITANLRNLRSAVQSLGGYDDLRRRVDRRLLAAGLMDDDYFETRRRSNPPVEELGHFMVALLQDLGPDWNADDARTPGCEGWTKAVYRYGVLAKDEESAVRVAISAQTGLFAAPPELLGVELQGGPFHDHPGVTWVGGPMPLEESGAVDPES